MRPVLPAGVLVFVLLIASCAQRRSPAPAAAPNATASLAPVLVLEEFLRASNVAASSDSAGIVAMSRLFGTRAGPTTRLDQRSIVEHRMFLIASILKHEDFRIVAEQIVPGRLHEARQFNLEMTIDQRKVMVPFTLVRTHADTWLVETIQLENITARR